MKYQSINGMIYWFGVVDGVAVKGWGRFDQAIAEFVDQVFKESGINYPITYRVDAEWLHVEMCGYRKLVDLRPGKYQGDIHEIIRQVFCFMEDTKNKAIELNEKLPNHINIIDDFTEF
jgi:hypothetical protein